MVVTAREARLQREVTALRERVESAGKVERHLLLTIQDLRGEVEVLEAKLKNLTRETPKPDEYGYAHTRVVAAAPFVTAKKGA